MCSNRNKNNCCQTTAGLAVLLFDIQSKFESKLTLGKKENGRNQRSPVHQASKIGIMRFLGTFYNTRSIRPLKIQQNHKVKQSTFTCIRERAKGKQYHAQQTHIPSASHPHKALIQSIKLEKGPDASESICVTQSRSEVNSLSSCPQNESEATGYTGHGHWDLSVQSLRRTPPKRINKDQKKC